MTSVATCALNTTPENDYRNADPAERKRIAAEVLRINARQIAALVRQQARGRDSSEAQQVAALALIEALELFDPDRKVKFWTFAFPKIRSALSNWAAEDKGYKRTRRSNCDPREIRSAIHRNPESFDEDRHLGRIETPESLLIEKEDRLRREVFLSGVTTGDRHRVFGIGRPHRDAARRNNLLRERAKLFLGGSQ